MQTLRVKLRTCFRKRPRIVTPRRGPRRLFSSDIPISPAAVKPYYITTPIFYPNADPHIGHLYSLVTADIFARYQRLVHPSIPVNFLAGTDEHGLKIQQAAQSQNMQPLEFCDKLSSRFQALARQANISNTSFVRTTQERHHAAVEHVWNELNKKGLIYKGSYSGWYSIADECFYTDKQITRIPAVKQHGIPAELVTSTETGSIVERYEEQNYMFRLSAFRETLLNHYEANPSSIFPSHYHSYVVDILKSSEGLEDLSISRPRDRLTWGVQVPGDPQQTVYVWFDALLVYLTGVGYPWRTGVNGLDHGWPPNLQVIGKDILRFHAIYFPAILQALSLPLPTKLLTHAHWTCGQKKMSKSVGNVVNPFRVMRTVNHDIVRYYLASVGGTFRDDVDWSEEELEKHSKEIQSFLGNFYLRFTSEHMTNLLTLARPRTRQEVYNTCLYGGSADPLSSIISEQTVLAGKVEECLDKLELGKALQLIIDLLKNANGALTAVAPWLKDPDTARCCYVVCFETLRIAGICLQPFIPDASRKLLDALHVPESERNWQDAKEGREVIDARGVRRFQAARFF